NIFVQNYKDIPGYTKAIEDDKKTPIFKGLTLTDDDQLRQAVINQLICHFELEFAPFNHAYQFNFCDYFVDSLEELQPMIDDGLIIRTDAGLKVSNDGRLLIRRICMAFDAYLKSPQPVRYSRII
ncbi:MAG: coproporphyrinogen III oxidase, partial [Pseudomonadota bacterium]|nr:coproporphyrinogen III oxidase [Pseudomonadota bacterium]